jgi:hypothetical protein
MDLEREGGVLSPGAQRTPLESPDYTGRDADDQARAARVCRCVQDQ